MNNEEEGYKGEKSSSKVGEVSFLIRGGASGYVESWEGSRRGTWRQSQRCSFLIRQLMHQYKHIELYDVVNGKRPIIVYGLNRKKQRADQWASACKVL